MEQLYVVDMIQRLIWLMFQLSMPVLIVTLVVGVVISIMQAVTQIQEASLTFVPKIIVAFVVIVLTAPWMIGTMVDYTTLIFEELHKVSRMRN
ncbi:MAG: flagellar biosynthesis protein FliQ [Vampirovibrionales bacterium]|nr:flagellar biosynthesis protein FliQ [Vampirovibrionales bacterium]